MKVITFLMKKTTSFCFEFLSRQKRTVSFDNQVVTKMEIFDNSCVINDDDVNIITFSFSG